MYKKGTFWERFWANIIDELLLIPLILIGIIAFNISGRKINFDSFDVLANLAGIIFFSYTVLFTWKRGATFGKQLLKLKVVDTEYKPIGFWKAFWREGICKSISGFLNLGYFWILIDKKRQSWHDKIAGTFVIKLDNNNISIPIQADEEVNTSKKVMFGVLFILFGSPLGIMAIFLITYMFITRPYQISGDSMAPRYTKGQYYLSQLIGYDTPQKGDVVVFHLPTNPDKDLIKRIIGLPGDKIRIKNGDVFLNNNKLDESSYVKNDIKTYAGSFLKEGQEVTVPPNQYFVLGDNRPFSSDSREWGFLPKKNIIGKMAICYYNCSDPQSIKNNQP